MARFDEEAKPMRADHIGDGLYYGEVYFVIGKPSETSKDNMVSSPPWAGAGNALIVDKGGKTVATTVVKETKDGWLKLAAYGFTFSKKTIKVKITKKKK